MTSILSRSCFSCLAPCSARPRSIISLERVGIAYETANLPIPPRSGSGHSWEGHRRSSAATLFHNNCPRGSRKRIREAMWRTLPGPVSGILSLGIETLTEAGS